MLNNSDEKSTEFGGGEFGGAGAGGTWEETNHSDSTSVDNDLSPFS